MTNEQLYELRDLCDETLTKVFNDIFKLEDAGFQDDDIYIALKDYYNGKRREDTVNIL